MLTRKGHARRQLLKGCAQSSILYLPLLRMFRESDAMAQEALKPNAIFAYYPLGGFGSNFWSSGTNGYPAIHSSIEALGLKDDFLLFKGLNFKGTWNHNGAHTNVFSGWGKANKTTGYGLLSSGVVFNDNLTVGTDLDATPFSLDQRLAKRWGVTPMLLGTVTGKSYTAFYEALSFTESGGHAYAEDNPATSFTNYFGTFSSSTSTGSTADTAAQKKVALAEAKVLDFLTADLKRIENALGSQDKAAFQAHLSALATINDSIVKGASGTGVVGAGCSVDGLKSKIPTTSKWYEDENQLGTVMEINRAMLVQALACGITRVGMHQIGCTHSTKQLRATGVAKVSTSDYHEMSHGETTANADAFRVIQTALVKEIAQIAVDLKAITTSSGTLFDNTLIMGSSCGGPDSGHTGTDVPAFFLGRLGGKINSGRIVSASNYNQTLVTFAQAVGETDITYVGNKKVTGAVSGVLK